MVSNRCRNLRKVIDRARALEAAEAEGQLLNEEQRESVRGIARKEAMLAELQEILKKQTAVAEPPEAPVPKLSRRAAKAARAKARDKEPAKSASEKGSEESELAEKDADVEANSEHGSDRHVSNGINLKEHEALVLRAEKAAEERDALLREITESKLKHDQQLVKAKRETVRKVLNLFHIVDFLRQPGSREALLAYHENPQAQPVSHALSNLHLDLLCYFNIMLTTPNGNVPHHDAVDVSTSHCVEFLRESISEAFEGSTYASLARIVDVVASCPILTERGDEQEDSAMQNGEGDAVEMPKIRSRAVIGNVPSHIVDDPVADDSLP